MQKLFKKLLVFAFVAVALVSLSGCTIDLGFNDDNTNTNTNDTNQTEQLSLSGEYTYFDEVNYELYLYSFTESGFFQSEYYGVEGQIINFGNYEIYTGNNVKFLTLKYSNGSQEVYNYSESNDVISLAMNEGTANLIPVDDSLTIPTGDYVYFDAEASEVVLLGVNSSYMTQTNYVNGVQTYDSDGAYALISNYLVTNYDDSYYVMNFEYANNVLNLEGLTFEPYTAITSEDLQGAYSLEVLNAEDEIESVTTLTFEGNIITQTNFEAGVITYQSSGEYVTLANYIYDIDYGNYLDISLNNDVLTINGEEEIALTRYEELTVEALTGTYTIEELDEQGSVTGFVMLQFDGNYITQVNHLEGVEDYNDSAEYIVIANYVYDLDYDYFLDITLEENGLILNNGLDVLSFNKVEPINEQDLNGTYVYEVEADGVVESVEFSFDGVNMTQTNYTDGVMSYSDTVSYSVVANYIIDNEYNVYIKSSLENDVLTIHVVYAANTVMEFVKVNN